jgi:serine/threonine protein kinase
MGQEAISESLDTSPAATLPAGTLRGDYILRECLGQGAAGLIYRAEHRLLGRQFALKTLTPALETNGEFHERLLHEARIVAHLRHPNIVELSDARHHDGIPFIVMELLDGEDLEACLARTATLAENETLEVGVAMAAALADVHAHGIIHRDVKPANVFLSRTPDGHCVPKLLDFGISIEALPPAAALTTTADHRLMGSPLYLAPEGVFGASYLDAQSDQYSLGAVLYECATGRPPFRGATLPALLELIANGVPDSPSSLNPSISRGLERVISRALSRDPADRYGSMPEMQAALAALVAPTRSAKPRLALPTALALPMPLPPTRHERPSFTRMRTVATLGAAIVGAFAASLGIATSEQPGSMAASPASATAALMPSSSSARATRVPCSAEAKTIPGASSDPAREGPAPEAVAPETARSAVVRALKQPRTARAEELSDQQNDR